MTADCIKLFQHAIKNYFCDLFLPQEWICPYRKVHTEYSEVGQRPSQVRAFKSNSFTNYIFAAQSIWPATFGVNHD